jgi:hypothetical protein
MTASQVLETAPHYTHLKAHVSRLDVIGNELRAHAAVAVDLPSTEHAIGLAVVVHWAEPIRSCALGDALVPPGARRIEIKVGRAAPLREVDVYGFATIAAYVAWLSAALISDSQSGATPRATQPSGNPPGTAGDNLNVPPIVG